MIKQKGKTVLIGKLSYCRISAALCSLCVKKMNPREQVGHGLSKRTLNILDQIINETAPSQMVQS